MTQEQTSLILLKIHGAYFSQDRFANSAEFSSRINLWDVYFKDFTYEVVNQAVTEWIASHKEMPQISDLIQRCKDLRDLANFPKDDPMQWKSYAEQVTIARKGDPDTWPDPDWLVQVRNNFIESMKAEQNNGKCLPYEI